MRAILTPIQPIGVRSKRQSSNSQPLYQHSDPQHALRRFPAEKQKNLLLTFQFLNSILALVSELDRFLELNMVQYPSSAEITRGSTTG